MGGGRAMGGILGDLPAQRATSECSPFMRLSAAFIFVVLLWSTTPLAIKWSGEGPGYLFGVTARMCLGLFCVLPVLVLQRQRLPLSRKALLAYLAGAVQIFGAMLVTYWASQFIPSGWISVVFGLLPLISAPMAALVLGERSLRPGLLLSYALGFGGLVVMFQSALSFAEGAALGVAGVIVAAILQAASAVWVKQINAGLPALVQVAGSLALAVPGYLVTFALSDSPWPDRLSLPSLLSIAYLGAIATPVGFALYFYVLNRLPATRVALITLITPVLSLYVGHVANGEPLHGKVLQGTALILAALLLNQWGTQGRQPVTTPPRRRSLRKRRRNSRGSAA